PVHRDRTARIVTNARQNLPCDLNLFRVDSCERLSNHPVRDPLQFLDKRMRARGDVKTPCAAVLRICNSLNEAGFFQTIDDASEVDRLDVEHVRKLDLTQTWLSSKTEQHLPLGARDSQSDRAA